MADYLSGVKKTVDFNDPRYKKLEYVKEKEVTQSKSPFTLYDGKDASQMAVDEIKKAYQLSNKKLSLNELLNKMMDYIVTFGKDARPMVNYHGDYVYAWRYGQTLESIVRDRLNIGESLDTFDNAFRYSVINNKELQEKYPGKYTIRTNFFDKKISAGLAVNIKGVFSDMILPDLHAKAIQYSKDAMESGNNPKLTELVDWVKESFDCETYFSNEIFQDAETKLYYEKDTLIVHLPNGYDVSVVGNYGTDCDNVFDVLAVNANNLITEDNYSSLDISQVKEFIESISEKDAVATIHKFVEEEEKVKERLLAELAIVNAVHPYPSYDVLLLEAAKGVVGNDYIQEAIAYYQQHSDSEINEAFQNYEAWRTEKSMIAEMELQAKQMLESIPDAPTGTFEEDTVYENPSTPDPEAYTTPGTVEEASPYEDEVVYEEMEEVETPAAEPDSYDLDDDLFGETTDESALDDLFSNEEPSEFTEEPSFGDDFDNMGEEVSDDALDSFFD